ncbi:MAG: hypothetical protein ACLFRB_06875 [Thiohalorhabdus sp.]|uniref:hypothetical protein n=1 Tax=Thiohalorhabdus sp. TaxID=3094134 RepID=UPI0039803C8C
MTMRVDELKRELERIEEMGCGDYLVVARPEGLAAKEVHDTLYIGMEHHGAEMQDDTKLAIFQAI